MSSRTAIIDDVERAAGFDDWRWQLRHRITGKEEIAARLPLTDEESAGLDAAPGQFRVAVTPYYFSLIDRDHPACPVRMQVIPRARELVNEPGDLVDPLGEDSHSPATGIFHRYPDRCLLLALDRCAIYCRHCNRRRLVGQEESPISRGDLDARARLHPAHARHSRRAHLGRRSADAVDRAARGDRRGAARHPARRDRPHRHARPGRAADARRRRAVRDAEEVPPALHQHALQPPQGADAAGARRLREAGRRRDPARQPDGAPARRELVGARCCASCSPSSCAAACAPTTCSRATSPPGTSHLRTSVETGIALMQELRGHISGLAIPHLVIDTPGGMGKVIDRPRLRRRARPRQVDAAQLRREAGRLPAARRQGRHLRLRRGYLRRAEPRATIVRTSRGRPTGRTGPACTRRSSACARSRRAARARSAGAPNADPAVLRAAPSSGPARSPWDRSARVSAEPHRQPLDVRVDDDALGDARTPCPARRSRSCAPRPAAWSARRWCGAPRRRSARAAAAPCPSGSWPSGGRSRSSG